MQSTKLILISIGALALAGQARADDPRIRSQGWGGSYGPPGHASWGHPHSLGGPSWVGVPGLDRGYDRWRWNANRSYRRGDFYSQGFSHRPYRPHGYGWKYGNHPYRYGWGSSW